MLNTVEIVGKATFKRKDGKTAYVLHIVNDSPYIEMEGAEVVRAYTNSTHYEKINLGKCTGYLSYEKGFPHFYLPKNEVTK